MIEDELVGWHYQLNGHEFEQTLGDGEGQGSLVCCSPWGCRELDTTQRMNTTTTTISKNPFSTFLQNVELSSCIMSCALRSSPLEASENSNSPPSLSPLIFFFFYSPPMIFIKIKAYASSSIYLIFGFKYNSFPTMTSVSFGKFIWLFPVFKRVLLLMK